MVLGDRLNMDGKEEGKIEGKLSIATRMVAEGMPQHFVAKIIELPLEKILEL